MDVWYWYQMKMRTFVYLWKISIIYLHSLRFHSVINQIVLNKNFNKTSSSLNKGRHCGIKSLYRYTYRHIVMFNPLNERLIYFTSSFAIVSWLFSYFANMHIYAECLNESIKVRSIRQNSFKRTPLDLCDSLNYGSCVFSYKAPTPSRILYTYSGLIF